MDIIGAFLLVAGPVALGVRGAVDGLRRLIDPASKLPSVLWVIAAFGGGIVTALVFRLDYSSLIVIGGNTANLSVTTGRILTGLGIGGAAMFWNTHLANRQADTKNKARTTPDGSAALPLVALR